MAYEYEPHAPRKTKSISWSVCQKCGLVYLNNDLTRWSVEKGCNASEHPQFRDVVKKYTGVWK